MAAPTVLGDDPAPRSYTQIPEIANGQSIIWHDPGAVEQLDFRYGIGGQNEVPAPPFVFDKEDTTGTAPKVQVKDANGRTWVIKFGHEAKPDVFGSRLAWAVGYWTEANYFVPQGVIQGVKHLTRAHQYVDGSGRFKEGRFQLRSDDPKYIENVNWDWDKNPFAGMPQLNGLKIMMMLVSNWDDKDYRDAATRGGNTAIYQQGGKYIFFIDDWGASFGNWGKVFTRSKWNCREYLDESRDFVKGVNMDIQWGYVGQHTGLMTQGVRPSDVQWLMQYLGRITDEQLKAGLESSGASPEETQNCIEGLHLRIGQLRTVGSMAVASAPAH
ncbi:MAG TPA: hypothetical protein VHW24_12270 [Bryobacteraceae bacterium]|jgi:hypothetical protein|nr:hypothetical protein [Bryobacteraceae bacterium]